MERTVQLKAYAKINLALDVVGKRPDGYHEVRMIMQTIKLYDRLTMRRLEDKEIRLKTNLSFLPVDDNNLVCRAIRLLQDTYQVSYGMEVELHKCIPVAAGMAGGSADCAAALVGASRLFGLGLKPQELMRLGVKLGADVPYCIMRGTALSEGIGEILTPLQPIPECFLLIAKPPISVSTKFVYEHLDAEEVLQHPDIDGMVEAIAAGSLTGIAQRMENVLETVTIPAHPVIADIKEVMLDQGAINALMSGSGPTVFGIFEKKEMAELAGKRLAELGMAKQIYITTPFQQERRGKWN
jgi:4-diphosphocytidyl-2-C-methyl-D-erythritol kinase